LKNYFQYFLLFLLLFINACTKKNIPSPDYVDNIHPLEVELFIKNYKKYGQDPFQHEILDYIFKQYLDTINVAKYFKDPYRRQMLHKDLQKFYEGRGYQFAWSSNDGTTTSWDHLDQFTKKVYQHGLSYDDYQIEQIKELRQQAFADGNVNDILQLLAFELKTSANALLLASHLSAGRISPDKIDTAWFLNAKPINFAHFLDSAIQHRKLKEAYQQLIPKQEDYKKLQHFLVRYLKIRDEVDWNSIPQNQALSLGDTSKYIPEIKQKLAILGDLDSSSVKFKGKVFNQKLVNAINKYQERHDLASSGKIDSETIQSLNITLTERAQKISLNMERFRWINDFGDHYLKVNIPEFKMKIYEDKEQVMNMKVVVGEEYNATPIFSDQMEYIVFNPRWTVPYSIATKEMLPKIKKNRAYLKENNYLLLDGWGDDAIEVNPDSVDWSEIDKDNFPFVIEQKSGSFNALGKVKFMLPNDYSIYLHDTPADYLFQNEFRGFSHGCIRLNRPFDLVDYLLQNKPGWNEQRLQDYLKKENPIQVSLPKQLPVHIFYQTVWVDEKGVLNFAPDIYGHDQAQLNALLEKENLL